MEGDISVISEYGKGSTFTIKLPQKIRSHEPLSSIEKTVERNRGVITKFNATDARVLIVDDIDVNLRVAEGLMQPYKMQIDLCLSGAKAIQMVKDNR
jgi:PleD family two-component response regulator